MSQNLMNSAVDPVRFRPPQSFYTTLEFVVLHEGMGLKLKLYHSQS
jgi:hypothetical protein